MSVDTLTAGIPDIVFTAPERGDVLRRVRSLHPRSEALTFLADAEAAAKLSELLLENAYRQHQDCLDRVRRAREAMTLNPVVRSVPVPAPTLFMASPDAGHMQVSRPVATAGDQGERLLGRITDRQRLTNLTKTAGKLRLESGEIVAWTAGSAYVDCLEDLFNGAPISFRGPVMPDGSISIQEVLPAPRAYWASDLDYEAGSELGAMTVLVESMMKRDLIKTRGNACQSCGHVFNKPKQASIAKHTDETLTLVCRPCKENWRDAGRPTLTAKAVAL